VALSAVGVGGEFLRVEQALVEGLARGGVEDGVGFSSLPTTAMAPRKTTTAPPQANRRRNCSLWTCERRWRMNATSARGTALTWASQTARLLSVAPRNVMKTPVATQTMASVTIASPAALARLFHIRIMRLACVRAKTKNGTAIRRPRTRCSSSIA
jgi:hypothetical protein